MADHDIPAYPFMFSSDQWANPYTSFGKKKLDFMGKYGGAPPTDAHGNPIQSYTDAQTAHDAWAAANPQQAPAVSLNTNPISPYTIAKGNPAIDAGNTAAGLQALNSMVPTGNGTYAAGPGTPANFWGNQSLGQSSAAQPAAAAPSNPYDMGQAYLAALQRPGKINTPGATVPQAAPPSNQSGVLQQFLANWQGGGGQTTGAGNYNNAGMVNALRGMV